MLLRALLLGVTLCPGAGWAQDRAALEQAKGHFDRGAALYNGGRYRAAEEEFLRAYELSHLPDLLFNLARAAERQGRPGAAVGYLERYLQERPDAPDRAQIEQEMSRLRQQAAAQQAAPPEGPQRRHGWPPWPALALGGGSAALLITGVALGGAALAAQAEIEGAKEGTRFDIDLHRRGQSLSAAAVALDVIGVAALAAGATWTGVWLLRQRQPAARVSLAPRGLGLQVIGSF